MSNSDILGAATGSGEPTWVLRVSTDTGTLDPVEMAQVLAPINPGYGCTIERALGVWDNQVEQALTITAQAGKFEVEKWLCAIAGHFPGLRWVHVERYGPAVDYVDLDVIGEFYGNRRG